MNVRVQRNYIKIRNFSAMAVLSLAATTFSTLVLAQDTLVDMVRTGDREAVLSAIAISNADINATESDGSTALLWATYAVDHDLVRALLDAGAEADITNLYGSTPLTEAVKLADAALVRMLLDANANSDSPNQDNQTALMLASYIGSLEIAEMLINSGATVNAIETFRGQTALMWAASENHPDLVELLMANDAEVSVRAAYDDWPRQMTSEPRAQFRPTGGLTALLYATRSGCYRCAVAIVEAGADVNQPNPDGVTPLINALDSKSFDIAMYLIDQGANVSAWDMNGRTPLYVAVDMNSFVPRGFFGGPVSIPTREPIDVTAMDVVNRLLEMGVDPNHQLTRMRPNAPNRGRFSDYMMRGGTGPLMIATLGNDAEAIQALLAHGAEVDLPNVFHVTPLMAAAGMNGSARGRRGTPIPGIQAQAISTIDLLLSAGADVNARVTDSHTYTSTLNTYIQGRDLEGQTAFLAAVNVEWDLVAEHLISRGAVSQ